LPQAILGYDVRRDAMHFSQEDARPPASGICSSSRCAIWNILAARRPPGLLICNPPYGERIGDEKELRGLTPARRIFRERCSRWKIVRLHGKRSWAADRKPAACSLFNGKIPSGCCSINDSKPRGEYSEPWDIPGVRVPHPGLAICRRRASQQRRQRDQCADRQQKRQIHEMIHLRTTRPRI